MVYHLDNGAWFATRRAQVFFRSVSSYLFKVPTLTTINITIRSYHENQKVQF